VLYRYEVGALNLSSTKLPRPWSPWESSPLRKNRHGRTGNRTRDHEAGRINQYRRINHGHYGNLSLQGNVPMVEPEIEPRTSRSVVRNSNH
jgi:hypothetical protein